MDTVWPLYCGVSVRNFYRWRSYFLVYEGLHNMLHSDGHILIRLLIGDVHTLNYLARINLYPQGAILIIAYNFKRHF